MISFVIWNLGTSGDGDSVILKRNTLLLGYRINQVRSIKKYCTYPKDTRSFRNAQLYCFVTVIMVLVFHAISEYVLTKMIFNLSILSPKHWHILSVRLALPPWVHSNSANLPKWAIGTDCKGLGRMKALLLWWTDRSEILLNVEIRLSREAASYCETRHFLFSQ